MGKTKKKEDSWWVRLLKSLKIVRGYDEDFEEDMKIGVKGRVEF